METDTAGQTAMRVKLTHALLAAILLVQACRHDCNVVIIEGSWAYRAKQHLARGESVCHFELTYNGRPLLGNATVITPIGTFEVMVQSEHGDSDSGWKRISTVTSQDVAIEGRSITDREINDAFYPQTEFKKRPGTPQEWIYMGGVVEPGWAHPSLLTDVNFLKQHPAER